MEQRIIKFRAWSEEFKMMFYSNSSDDPTHMTGEQRHSLCGNNKPLGHLDYFFSNKSPIMQYTGLHDKNGKEIFEGDLIRGFDWHNCNPSVVSWDVIGFRIPLMANAYEIIGNIYENPELIKGDK